MTDDRLMTVLNRAATSVATALEGLHDWGPAGTREGQYLSDVVADQAAVGVLVEAGLGVLSEETGLHHADRPVIVALDPVDGSTNAARGLPWYATSLCAVDRHGIRAAVVVNLATGECFEAVRGEGATRNGEPVATSGCADLGEAVVGLNGWPAPDLGWRQMRALGAASLDLCAVGAGMLDAYVDCSAHALAPWDYLGGVLVCQEAGGAVADADGRQLATLGPTERRRPVAAATETLLAAAVEVRARLG